MMEKSKCLRVLRRGAGVSCFEHRSALMPASILRYAYVSLDGAQRRYPAVHGRLRVHNVVLGGSLVQELPPAT
jgi:hypothetical protein